MLLMWLTEKFKYQNMTGVQHCSYEGFGLMALQCPIKACNYCKKLGHFIKEYPIRPPRKSGASYVATFAHGFASPPTPAQVLVSPILTQNSITPKMIRQMGIFA